MTLALLLLLSAAEEKEGALVRSGALTSNPATWVTSADYPFRAMIEARGGTTSFLLAYDDQGLPRGCDIVGTSGHEDLDTATCRLVMERARFKPGRDAKGRPIGGTYSNRIRWKAPEGGRAMAFTPFVREDVGESWPSAAKPTASFRSVRPADHYPAEALAAGEEGVVQMAVWVAADGSVERCEVTDSSKSAALDAASCALMRSKGAFHPALGADGQKVQAKLQMMLRWVLPRAGAMDSIPAASASPTFPFARPTKTNMTLVLDADGQVKDCKFNAVGEKGELEWPNSLCSAMSNGRRFAPFRDAGGKAVARRVELRTELTIEPIADRP